MDIILFLVGLILLLNKALIRSNIFSPYLDILIWVLFYLFYFMFLEGQLSPKDLTLSVVRRSYLLKIRSYLSACYFNVFILSGLDLGSSPQPM